MNKPLAIDLYCGLGGWSEGLLAEGFDVIGFDIERHVYGEHRYPGQLVIQDVLTLHGSQFKDAALIVASPPCTEYSYMAMPWKRAKAKAAAIRADTTGAELERLNRLFNACLRIQFEASLAAGRHVPLIIENVKGAQPWVGRARWNFGSFYLWGDVPALMPKALRIAKVPGLDWNGSDKPGYVARAFNTTAEQRLCGQKSRGIPHIRDGEPHTKHLTNPNEHGRKASPGDADGWFGDYEAMKEGIKQRGSGREWFAGDGKISRMTSSGSPARKMASAMIAKIPLPLSRHIGATFHPN